MKSIGGLVLSNGNVDATRLSVAAMGEVLGEASLIWSRRGLEGSNAPCAQLRDLLQTELVFVLNEGEVPLPGALQRLLAVLEQHDADCVLGARGRVNAAQRVQEYVRGLSILASRENLRGAFDTMVEYPYLSGSLIRAAVLDRLNPSTQVVITAGKVWSLTAAMHCAASRVFSSRSVTVEATDAPVFTASEQQIDASVADLQAAVSTFKACNLERVTGSVIVECVTDLLTAISRVHSNSERSTMILALLNRLTSIPNADAFLAADFGVPFQEDSAEALVSWSEAEILYRRLRARHSRQTSLNALPGDSACPGVHWTA